jgi:uncharacterized protein (TIGR03437 family)
LSKHRPCLLAALCLSRLIAATSPEHPLYFEQRDRGLFETRYAGQSVIVRADQIELEGVTLRFVHASKKARLEGVGTPAPGTYITRGQTRTFSQYPGVHAHRLYPGIDAVFYGTPGHLEYDLDLARGSSTVGVRIAVDGALGLRLGEQGDLIVKTRSGEMRQLAPRVFQTRHGIRERVSAGYLLLDRNEIGFRLGKHDPAIPLTIDPVIVYTKYFGGSGSDSGGPVATDAQGNVYVTGNTNSIDFPSTNGTKARLQPPLLAFSNGGQTVSPLPVGTQVSVTTIGGTADGKVLYVATPDGIFISGDHGATFAQGAPLVSASGNLYGSPTVRAISVDAIDPSRAFFATSAGLFIMSGAGQAAGQNQQGIAVAGNNMVDSTSVQVSPVDHMILYAATGIPNNLYKSVDAGATWHQLNSQYPGEPAVQPFSGTSVTFTLAPNGSDLYVVDGNANLLKSTDGGATWLQLAGQLFNAKSITIDSNNPSSIYIVDNFGVQQSTNGGVTFATITPPMPGGVYVQTFALDPSSGDLYFATFTQIEVSVDHGATWKNLPARPEPHVLIGLGNQVFAGLDSPTVPFVVKWNPDGSQMLYSTFFGGSFSDSIAAITVNAQGQAIIAGNTASSDFPVTHTLSAPGSQSSSGFVAKLSADGTQAIYSAILGGSKGVTIDALAIDASGTPYITGSTPSPDFPTTTSAAQPKLPTAACQRTTNPLDVIPGLGTYGFISKLSADASSLVYSTFLTGACGSVGQGIAVDAAGEAVVAGTTPSPDFPVLTNAYQTTFPGGSAASSAYPNPVDFGFVTRLSAAGDKLLASSFIGGGYYTQAGALALDSSGNAYVTGLTWGITPGATPGAYQSKVATGCPPVFNIGPGPIGPSGGSDVFLLKLDPAFSHALFLTYLGGICDDFGTAVVLEPSDNVWLAGRPSQDFPLVMPYEGNGTGPNFVSEFNADASQLLFSSSSDGANLAMDPSGSIYVSGTTQVSGGLKKNTGFGSGNIASLVKIDPAATPPVVINSIGVSTTNKAVPGSSVSSIFPQIAPGELIDITGQHLGSSETLNAKLDSTGRLPFQLGATSVYFDGYLAPLISIQDGLIVCFAPFEITSKSEVTVIVDGQRSNMVRVGVAASAPTILTIVNPDGTVNSAAHPAPAGSVITFYVTGLGVTFPLSQDGSVSAPPLPVPVTPVMVYLDGMQITPQFAAAADGLVAGITQVNVQLPASGLPANPVNVSVSNGVSQIYVSQ